MAVWKGQYPKLAETLKKGKEVVDIEVENALLKRALGFEYMEKTYESTWNPTLNKYIKVNTKNVTKMVVPDTTAQIFWLKNRKPDCWRNAPIAGGTQSEESDNLYQAILEAVKK